jgi:hypothetical protein
MGAEQSVVQDLDNNKTKNNNEIVKYKNTYFKDQYNWIPSFSSINYLQWNKTSLDRRFDTTQELPNYIDLRNDFPTIRSMFPYPFNPIISVLYILHYQLVKNGLPVFPPSAMYTYKNMFFYKNVSSIMSFETIFNSILNNGICSENDYATNDTHFEDSSSFDNKLVEKSRSFQFIEIHRVEHKLDVIKTLLKNRIPILCGLVVYYDMKLVDTHMWLPDHNTDEKLGGIAGVLVGYIEERKVFIMSTTHGQSYGMSGFIFLPYDYILNPLYNMEMYTIDFNKERVDGYIHQHRDMVVLQNKKSEKVENEKKFKRDDFGGIFKN